MIEAADAELLALRRALNSREPRRYDDFLAAQGLAPGLGPNPGYITTDVPCALVLASSLGQAAGVLTPEIDGLVAEASAMWGQDLRAGAGPWPPSASTGWTSPVWSASPAPACSRSSGEGRSSSEATYRHRGDAGTHKAGNDTRNAAGVCG